MLHIEILVDTCFETNDIIIVKTHKNKMYNNKKNSSIETNLLISINLKLSLIIIFIGYFGLPKPFFKLKTMKKPNKILYIYLLYKM